MGTSGGPHDREMAALRRRNVATCVVVMRDRGTATLTEVSRLTGLSRTTVESILDELIETGLVRAKATPAAGQGAGRPARQYGFRPEHRQVLGVDIGMHTVRALLVDLAGTVTVSEQIDVSSGVGPRDRIEAIRETMRRALVRGHLSGHRVHTAVAALPGIVAPDGTVLLSNPVPEWTGANLSALLGEGFDFPVVVENDVNMAALAEHAIGAAQLVEDVVYVHLGHRMSAALIIDGRIHRGKHFAAGEVANLAPMGWAVREDDEIKTPTGFGSRAARDVITAAGGGDADAISLVERLAEQIAPGVATLGATLDPDLVVIGGGLSHGGEALLGPLRRAVAKVFRNREAPPLASSQLGAQAGALGAAVRGLQIVSLEIYGTDEPSIPRIKVTSGRKAGNERQEGEGHAS